MINIDGRTDRACTSSHGMSIVAYLKYYTNLLNNVISIQFTNKFCNIGIVLYIHKNDL
ncbi:hypothetical protein BD408DRAFT_413663 [Parasitella parasitica]|nr:hypothetical protein BD408DRAFT_413663 [Parasitella parasitica]